MKMTARQAQMSQHIRDIDRLNEQLANPQMPKRVRVKLERTRGAIRRQISELRAMT